MQLLIGKRASDAVLRSNGIYIVTLLKVVVREPVFFVSKLILFCEQFNVFEL